MERAGQPPEGLSHLSAVATHTSQTLVEGRSAAAQTGGDQAADHLTSVDRGGPHLDGSFSKHGGDVVVVALKDVAGQTEPFGEVVQLLI